MYHLIRSLLFRLDPEFAHHLALLALRYVPKRCFNIPKFSREHAIHAMGLSFPHPIGLAAGLDKNAQYLDGISKVGFSFIEIGTVTPRPQTGNPKPRLFRIMKAQALINRMGFNNEGIEALIARIVVAKYSGILGINIGKNKDTPLDKAVDDYVFCLKKVYPFASYVTINISSPNTTALRALQGPRYFELLMNQLSEEHHRLADKHGNRVPIVVKISPDETDESLKRMANTIVNLGIDGMIATNTTTSHNAVSGFPQGNEEGGVSGPPLFSRSTACLRILKQVVGEDVTLIGVGGIQNLQDIREKLAAGAKLVQLYTGLIYEGPFWVKKLVNNWVRNESC
jgi:dihydroorotate dehydrogenase